MHNFSDEQVEAAAKAAYEYAQENATVPMPRREWESLGWMDRGLFEGEVRAALEAAARAAQGAAPQAESSPTSSYISQSLPGMIRNLWKGDPSENSVRTALKLAGDLIQELIDLKAAPVLPSSGVDEDALAEVINAALDKWEGYEPSVVFVARAVAAWLKDGAQA